MKYAPSLYHLAYIALVSLLCFSCSEDRQTVVIPDNNAPPYEGIPTVIIENYVNRLYIDLIGREPFDAEMIADVELLKANNLSEQTRRDIATRLQTSQSFIEGDSSYWHAYHQRIYDMTKARLLEGVADYVIWSEIGIVQNGVTRDSLAGDSVGVQQGRATIAKYFNIMSSHYEYRRGEISISEMYARMLNNPVYDLINMNSFNFINACFDDLFFRFPTNAEFLNSFDVIEYNTASTLFGQPCQTKDEYVDILINSREYYEGMIRWVYQALLAREPSTAETNDKMQWFYTTNPDLARLQLEVVITDEYANF